MGDVAVPAVTTPAPQEGVVNQGSSEVAHEESMDAIRLGAQDPSQDKLEAVRAAEEELRAPEGKSQAETLVAANWLAEIYRLFGARDPFGTPRCVDPNGRLEFLGRSGSGSFIAPGLRARQGWNSAEHTYIE